MESLDFGAWMQRSKARYTHLGALMTEETRVNLCSALHWMEASCTVEESKERSTFGIWKRDSYFGQ